MSEMGQHHQISGYFLWILVMLMHTVGAASVGQVAIQKIGSCDFSGGNTCGYTIRPHWRVQNGPYSSIGSGALPGGHNTGSGDAHYALYYPLGSGKDEITSPMLDPATSCISFWYVVSGSNSYLAVLTRTGSLDLHPHMLWNVTGGTSIQWTHVSLPLSMSTPIQIVFRTRGYIYETVGVDDIEVGTITVTPGPIQSTTERHEPTITTTNARTTTKYKTTSEPISVGTPTTTYKPTHKINPTTTNKLTTTIKPTTTYKTTSTIKRVYTYMYHTYKPTTTNLPTPTMKWTPKAIPTQTHTHILTKPITQTRTTPPVPDTSRTAAPKITLEDTIQVGCNAFGWDIKVHLPRLRQLYPNLRPSDVYFGDNSCIGVERADILLFQQGLRQCLTAERVSGSSLVYTNDLIYAVHDPVHPFIIRQFNWTFTVECDVQRNESTSAHLHHDNPTDVGNHHGTVMGHYNVSLAFYSDINFEREIPGNPVNVHVGESVYVKVYTLALDWTVKMRVNTCYTKPAEDAPDHMKYYLIKDGCERDSSTHIISQYTHETKFVFREFEYSTNHEGLNVYCDATFCDASDFSPACLQTCAPTTNV